MTQRCLADISGPFYDPSKPFRNWSSLPFYQLDRLQPPYVDHNQLAHGLERALTYLHQIHAQGYTGIVIDNLAHLVTFARAPVAIYAPDSPYRLRAACYQQAFGTLFTEAAQLGMEVFVTSDMQWSTPPIRAYVGRMDSANQRLAQINGWALDELFALFPQVTGLVVRTGEAGGAHNQGAAYTGHMLYTTAGKLRGLIDALLPVCERHDRTLIIRTWSVGIGEVGDLLSSPERYKTVFGGYTSPHLMVSIKHVPSDFFRLQPPNPTLGLPGPRQLIELQNRREYELFGMVPSSIAELHGDVLRHAEATNPRFAGVWAWNSTGGWGGGRAALGTRGWSIWTELSSALTAALVHDPALDPDAYSRRWCDERFGGPFGAAVADLYGESADLIERGWYVGRMRRDHASWGSLYLPSLLWIWWMRPTASLVTWAYIVEALEHSGAAEHASTTALARLDWHAERLTALAPADCLDGATVVASARYFADLIAIAHAIRSLMLRAFTAAWHDQRSAWDALADEARSVRQLLARHHTTWSEHPDLPPLELGEIDAFLRSFGRTPGILWAQARLACMVVRRRNTGWRFPGAPSAARIEMATSLTVMLIFRRPAHAAMARVLVALLLAPPLRQRFIKVALPVLSRRFYLLPSIFFETGPAFSEWTA